MTHQAVTTIQVANKSSDAVAALIHDTDAFLPCLFVCKETKLYTAKRTRGTNGQVGTIYDCIRLKAFDSSKKIAVLSFEIEEVSPTKFVVLQKRVQKPFGGTLVKDNEEQSSRHTVEWTSDTNSSTTVTWTEEFLWKHDYITHVLNILVTLGCILLCWLHEKVKIGERYSAMFLYLRNGTKLPLIRKR